MVLNTVEGRGTLLRLFIIGVMVAGAITFGGCAAGEETMSEEEGFEEATPTETTETAEEPAKKDESGDQQALTSFIGAAPPKKEEEPKKEEPKTEPMVQTATGNPLEDLRTENTSLKQKLVKLEQDNRTLSARLSDTETKYMSEKERAEKAEEAARVAAQSAVLASRGDATVRGKDMSESRETMTAYETALKSFKSKQYDTAISQLQGMLDGGAATNIADNCHYWLGESNFGKRNYQEALKHFDMVFEFKNSEKRADAQFMAAQCYERLGNKAKAKEAYERVVKDYPTSNNVNRAKQRWARL